MLFSLLRPLLFKLEPEQAHNVTIKMMRLLGRFKKPQAHVKKSITVMGLNFPNRVGLAAGLDKNAEAIDGFANLGFGFIEVGTVTPRPQPGNPKPRLFRIPEAHAIINRMGFNNVGLEQLIANLQQTNFNGILGINIGKNADTPMHQAVDDYLIGLRAVYPYASYVTVNISSPNTANIRDLQHGDALNNLLSVLKTAQTELAQHYQRYVPLVIKIAPDLTTTELAEIAEQLLVHKIDGIIATNTTRERVGIENSAYANEAGGLSGAPLYHRATEVVRVLSQQLAGRIPIVAAGGIMSVTDAQEKIAAGATLVQIYTGLIYHGPRLVQELAKAL